MFIPPSSCSIFLVSLLASPLSHFLPPAIPLPARVDVHKTDHTAHHAETLQQLPTALRVAYELLSTASEAEALCRLTLIPRPSLYSPSLNGRVNMAPQMAGRCGETKPCAADGLRATRPSSEAQGTRESVPKTGCLHSSTEGSTLTISPVAVMGGPLADLHIQEA